MGRTCRTGQELAGSAGLAGLARIRRRQAQPAQVPPPDGEWTANAVLAETRAITDLGLGAVQGVVVRDGKVYAYGDVFSAKPRWSA